MAYKIDKITSFFRKKDCFQDLAFSFTMSNYRKKRKSNDLVQGKKKKNLRLSSSSSTSANSSLNLSQNLFSNEDSSL